MGCICRPERQPQVLTLSPASPPRLCGRGQSPSTTPVSSSTQYWGAATQTLCPWRMDDLAAGSQTLCSHQLHVCHEWAVCPSDPRADRIITASCVPNKTWHHWMHTSLSVKDGKYLGSYVQVFRNAFSEVSLKDASILITHNVYNWNMPH